MPERVIEKSCLYLHLWKMISKCLLHLHFILSKGWVSLSAAETRTIRLGSHLINLRLTFDFDFISLTQMHMHSMLEYRLTNIVIIPLRNFVHFAQNSWPKLKKTMLNMYFLGLRTTFVHNFRPLQSTFRNTNVSISA